MNLIDQLMYSLDISQLTGIDKKGVHPIHGSSNGNQNLIVDKKMNTWYCFRHGAGTNVFHWIAVEYFNVECDHAQEFTRNNWVDIVNKACEITGIENTYQEAAPEKKNLYDILAIAQEYFVQELKNNPEIYEIISNQWGFDEIQTNSLNLGFAPPDSKNNLLKYLLSKGITRDQIEETGLFHKFENSLVPHFVGRITLPYTYYNNFVFFIARKIEGITPDKPHEQGKYKKQLIYKDKRPYISEYVKEPILGEDRIKRTNEVIVVEGITDWMSLTLNGIPAISPVTVRFKNSHIKRIKELCKHKRVYIANDNEINDSGLKGAISIVKSIPYAKIIEIPRKKNVEKIDINDYFRNHTRNDFILLKNKAKSGIEVLINNTHCSTEEIIRYAAFSVHVNPDDVHSFKNENGDNQIMSLYAVLEYPIDMKTAIIKMQHKKISKLTAAMKRDIMGFMIGFQMLHDGKFIVKEGTSFTEDDDKGIIEHIYYYSKIKELRKLSSLKSMITKEYRLAGYGISHLIDIILGLAQRHVEQHKIISDPFYYDTETNELIIQSGYKNYYLLDGKKITKYTIGDNNIFSVPGIINNSNANKSLIGSDFEYIHEDKRKLSPKDIIGIIDVPEYFRNSPLLISTCCRSNFTKLSALNETHQRIQLALYLLSIPFANIIRTKPIGVFSGETNSGKTMTLEFLQKIIYGPDVKLLTIDARNDRDVRTLENLYSRLNTIFIDNADRPARGLIEKMISASTGALKPQAELYTTDGLKMAEHQCFTCVTTRIPDRYTQEDLVNRSIFFHHILIPRTLRSIEEKVLNKPFTKYYSELKSEYLDLLNEIIREIKIDRDIKIKSKNRFSDWTSLSIKIASILGIPESETSQYIQSLEKEQIAFNIGNDILINYILELFDIIDNHPEEILERRFLKTIEFYNLLSEYVPGFRDSYQVLTKFGSAMKNRQSILKHIGIYHRKNPKTKRNEYWIDTSLYKTLNETKSNNNAINEWFE